MEYQKAVFTDISDRVLWKTARIQIEWMFNQMKAIPEQEQKQYIEGLLKYLEMKYDES